MEEVVELIILKWNFNKYNAFNYSQIYILLKGSKHPYYLMQFKFLWMEDIFKHKNYNTNIWVKVGNSHRLLETKDKPQYCPFL